MSFSKPDLRGPDLAAASGAPGGHGLLKGIFGAGGLAFTTVAVGLVQIPLVLSYLDRETAGVWFLFTTVGVFFTFLDLGVGPTLSREIGFVLGNTHMPLEEKRRVIADWVATTRRIFTWVCGAGGILAGAIGLVLLRSLPLKDPSIFFFPGTVFIVGAMINILNIPSYSALFGLGYVGVERGLRSLSLLAGFGLATLFLKLGWGVAGLSFSWLLQNGMAGVLGRRLMNRKFPSSDIRATARKSIFDKLVGPSLKWSAMSLGALLIFSTDNPLIGLFLGPSHIPPYEAMVKVVNTLLSFSLILSSSSVPFISKAFAMNDSTYCRKIIFRNARLGVGMMIFFVSFFAFFGERIMGVWLGGKVFVGPWVMWTLLVVLTFECHHVIHATSAMAAGKIVFLWPALIAGASKILLSVLLVRSLGLPGLALSTLLAQLTTNNWYAPYVSLHVFQVSFTDYAKRVLGPLGVYVAALLCLNRFLIGALPSREGWLDAFPLGCGFLLSAMFAVGLGYLLLTEPGEKKRIVEMVKRGSAS